MISVRFHPQAEAEFIAAAKYYESQQENLGQRFISSVEAGIARIKSSPHLFPVITENVRQCLTRTFPFGIVFRDTEEQIEIIAVMHLKREPGYWHERN